MTLLVDTSAPNNFVSGEEISERVHKIIRRIIVVRLGSVFYTVLSKTLFVNFFCGSIVDTTIENTVLCLSVL